MPDIKELKNKLFTTYGIALKEDDPAWLMVLIYNDLLKEVNKSINDLQNMPKITEANGNILTALSDLQLKTSDLFDTAEEITGKVTTENKVFIDGIAEQIDSIKTVIKSSVNDAISGINIDTKKLEDIIINKLAGLDLSKVDEFIEKISDGIKEVNTNMNASIAKLNNGNALIEKSVEDLNGKAEKINDAVGNINSANKSLSMAMTLAMIFVGIVIGFGTATYFKIDAISDNYFSSYEKKVKYEKEVNNELLDMINENSKLEKWLVKNKIKIDFGTFNDSTRKYISIPAKHSEEQYISKENNSVTVIK